MKNNKFVLLSLVTIVLSLFFLSVIGSASASTTYTGYVTKDLLFTTVYLEGVEVYVYNTTTSVLENYTTTNVLGYYSVGVNGNVTIYMDKYGYYPNTSVLLFSVAYVHNVSLETNSDEPMSLVVDTPGFGVLGLLMILILTVGLRKKSLRNDSK